MSASVPESEWVWCGWAGHCIGAPKCLLRLHTRVGDYRVSTVGAYVPRSKDYKEIGYQRFAETYVFRVSGHGVHGEGEVSEWSKIDTVAYPRAARRSAHARLGQS